jgi:hypothetical protein
MTDVDTVESCLAKTLHGRDDLVANKARMLGCNLGAFDIGLLQFRSKRVDSSKCLDRVLERVINHMHSGNLVVENFSGLMHVYFEEICVRTSCKRAPQSAVGIVIRLELLRPRIEEMLMPSSPVRARAKVVTRCCPSTSHLAERLG